MTTDIEYRKGVLYIRIKGLLVGKRVREFEEEVIPIALGMNAKYITVNMSSVDMLDNKGIESLIKLSSIANNNQGKLVICEINELIKQKVFNSDVFDYCYKTRSEHSSLGVFSV